MEIIDNIVAWYEYIYTDDIVYLQYIWQKSNDILACGINYSTFEQFNKVR